MNHARATVAESSPENRKLYIAFELADKKWKVKFGDGYQNPSDYTIPAGDIASLTDKIERARRKFKVSEGCEVTSCYEAGRDGFWLHRHLEEQGVRNLVVDPASIEVNRRKRRAKTDGIDLKMLFEKLVRYDQGQKDVWRVAVVPSLEEEDARRPHRELERVQKEATQHKNRIRSLLKLHGITVGRIGGVNWGKTLEDLRCWDGSELPEKLKAELDRETQRLEVAREQIRKLEGERNQAIAQAQEAGAEGNEPIDQVVKLAKLKGIGPVSSWLFVMEVFGWRTFKNGKKVGGYSGMTGTPYDSGESQREQGISKAGNRRMRRMAVEIAWSWVRFQPNSELSRWFNERYASGGGRMRRIGIVALARKLLVALWRYLEKGVIPKGAEFKAAM